jgi:U3 small nucleolar RNA-associated protein 14
MVNPWLVARNDKQLSGPKRNEIALGKDSTSEVKSKNKLSKKQRQHTDKRELERDDAVVEIANDAAIMLPSNESTKKLSKKRQKAKVTAVTEAESDTNSEVEEQEQLLNRKKNTNVLRQRELVAMAFAGDNVVRVGSLAGFCDLHLTNRTGIRRDEA